jgi:hypothetical protein
VWVNCSRCGAQDCWWSVFINANNPHQLTAYPLLTLKTQPLSLSVIARPILGLLLFIPSRLQPTNLLHFSPGSLTSFNMGHTSPSTNTLSPSAQHRTRRRMDEVLQAATTSTSNPTNHKQQSSSQAHASPSRGRKRKVTKFLIIFPRNDEANSFS